MITAAAVTDGVKRAASPITDFGAAWSVFLQCKPAMPGAFANTFWLAGDPTYATPYIWFGVTTTNLWLEIYDGVSFFDVSVAPNPTFGVTAAFGLTYTPSTSTISVYQNNVVVETLVVNLGAITFTQRQEYILTDNNGGGSTGGSSIAYFREWDATLDAAAFVLETASVIAVRTANLLSDTPLQASIDLTAHNNTLTQWTAIGTVITDTSDPLVSVVAGPPTNTTASTAVEVTTDSVIFQDVVTAGHTLNPVWFKYTVTESGVFGQCGLGNTSLQLADYMCRTNVFEGLANALAETPYIGGISSLDSPLQFPGTAGNTYYFKCAPRTDVATALLQFSLLKALNLAVPAGSIAVNDDSAFFPLAILDAATGYPIRFINPFPNSEAGVVLNSGNLLVADENEIVNGLKLYSSDFQTIFATIALAADSDTKIATNGTTKFLVGFAKHLAVNAHLRLISDVGTLTATVFDLGAANDIWAVGLTTGADKAYFVKEGFNLAIKAWDLVNNVALADLVAGIGADYATGKDILVITNSQIVVPYTSDLNDKIIAYDASGAVQHSVDLPQTGSHNGEDNRVFSAIDSPNSFWTWIRYADGISRFINIKYSDFSFLTDITPVQFENGAYQGVRTNTPVRFGHSESCPAWIVREAIIAIDPPDPNAPTWKLIGVDLAYQRLKGLRRDDP